MAWEGDYRNIIVSGPNQQEIARTCYRNGFSAFISPTIHGVTAIYEDGFSRKGRFEAMAQAISHHFHCTALLVEIHEEWILTYDLFRDGELMDEYCSFPNYGDDEPVENPIGGNASVLCAAFHKEAAIQRIAPLLRRNINEFDGEINRLWALAKELEIPTQFCQCLPVGEEGFLQIGPHAVITAEEDIPSPW